MENSEFAITKAVSDNKTQIVLSGEIDIYTSQTFKTELNEIVNQTKGDIYLDCRDLSYIDSTGLGILVGALKEIRKENNDIYISNLKENIKKLFVITGLDRLFKIN